VRWCLAVDPAVTSRKTSDYTGLAIVGKLPEQRRRPDRVHPKGLVVNEAGAVVRYSAQVRLTGQHLKDHVVQLLALHPEVTEIVVETNQGGDLWRDVFTGIPGVKVRTVNSSESKDVRFATALEFWQRRRVWHSVRHATLEEQAVGFPRHAYDDVVDAAVIGVQHQLGKGRKLATAPTTDTYLEAS
jgi:phage terminase large subunit-like protein